MGAPILATKLFVPPPLPKTVSRPRLIERLDEGLGPGKALTLVSAPAGFGKTTLVGAWAAACGRAVAWLSLDERDGDSSTFLGYLIAALQCVDPACGADAMAALQSPMPPSAEAIIAELVNEIDGLSRDILLVLDDYHAVDSPQADAALALLLEHPSARLRLAIVTREDPGLPLARLRARGELCELRAADLRFTPEEAAEFLERATGLELKSEEVAVLEERTEGWIAGLQLAALSMRAQEDRAAFIASFGGSHRFVLDYLAEEVLRRESEGIQSFLLRTSILDRLCAPLCDAVLQDSSGRESLDYLERANLFLLPLDGERNWYRYHQLFAELLRQRLKEALTSDGSGGEEGMAELRIRASGWCEEKGLGIEAFRYAAAAGDLDRAERLVASTSMPLHTREAVTAVLEWLASLSERVLEERPSLRVLFATTSLIAGRPAGVEEALGIAEAALSARESDPRTRDLLGRIAAARATLAVTRYRSEEILAQSRRALELLSPDDLPFRMTATWTVAVAHFFENDRRAEGRAFSELESLSRADGDLFFEQLALCGLGETRERDNLLREAEATYRRAIVLFGDHPQPNANEAHLGLARVLYEWNDLAAAESEGERGLDLARQYDEAIDRFIPCELLLSRVKLARGDAAAAAAKLDELAAAARRRGFLHRLPEIAAQRILVHLSRGEVEEASRLAFAYELPLSRARVSLARGEAAAARALLEARRAELEARGMADEGLRVLAVLALACRAEGRGEEALRLVGEAMKRAEGGGFVRLFLDEGEDMAELLSAAETRGIEAAHAGSLLALFRAERGRREEAIARAPSPLDPSLADPLSARELEVLKLLAEGLSNREIGERLFLALDTIKGHNRRIFDKLDAKRRTEAIARARDLGLV